jgi:hypothetical protein
MAASMAARPMMRDRTGSLTSGRHSGPLVHAPFGVLL